MIAAQSGDCADPDMVGVVAKAFGGWMAVGFEIVVVIDLCLLSWPEVEKKIIDTTTSSHNNNNNLNPGASNSL